ncbi:sensor histidine kinase [Paenibacillus nanensis]|uniref:histidine kinase n=1 Tax=Paenibacillus nanensis TaxID=393251 RepID=A0A3A1VQF5_9BACL|nr:sensor histidine kinase [Paenibacillus nanensis]RIX59720.1 sensor histidine kinase [Paenibacillus nanensis]
MVYSSLTIVSFCTLALLVYEYSASSLRQKELAGQAETVDSLARYLDSQMDDSQDIILQLYQNQALLSDMLYFLRHDIQLYIQYRFNRYIASNSSEDRNVETFIRSHMERNNDIMQIALYSRDQSFLFLFNSNKTQKLRELGDEEAAAARAIEAMGNQRTISTQALGIADSLELQAADAEGAYTYAFELNDPNTLQNVGALLVTYSRAGLSRLTEMTANEGIGSYLVVLPDGRVAFDSSEQYSGQIYPSSHERITVPGAAKLENGAYVTSLRTSKSDLIVIGLIPSAELENRYASFRRNVILSTAAGIAVTILFSYFTVYRYARRTRTIVKAMKQAQQGNLSVRVPTGRNDELDEIADRFNRMCEELLRYINQVYVSEIKQKHAELVAFQAQINPHFLYNTLEAIRMRALTQGAADVGEMAYVLGSLFRYAVKSETLVTIEDEAEYSKQFLELYRIRYRDKLSYSIEIDNDVKHYRIFKLSLQPLIENAVVHGIRPSKPGNKISIKARREEDAILLELADNGRGMNEEKLTRVRLALEGHEGPGGSASLGLRSVHERIRLTYGERYGLRLASEPDGGTVVRLYLPYGKENG